MYILKFFEKGEKIKSKFNFLSIKDLKKFLLFNFNTIDLKQINNNFLKRYNFTMYLKLI